MFEDIVTTSGWNKTFPKGDDVVNRKVTFNNRFGITLVADVYAPLHVDSALPAVAISGPFGAVKEQCSGLYAQTLARLGYLTVAFDPSFTGESSGFPRRMASPDVNTEDFQAAIDYLVCDERVDQRRVGILGICGFGGFALNTAALDTRIRATVAVTMYDMSRVTANGYFDEQDDEEARYRLRVQLNNQRTVDFKNKSYRMAGGCLPLPVPESSPFFVKDYSAYYKGRAYHERSGNSNDGWASVGCMSFLNQPICSYVNEIRSAVLLIHGEKAHSRYFSEDAYKKMTAGGNYAENKELFIVDDAVHTDLYDNLDKIPFNKIDSFFKTYMV